MNKNKYFRLLFLSAIAVSGSTWAEDGTIQMNGSLTSTTCSINGLTQTGSPVATLNFPLGNVPASSFSQAGIAGPVVTNGANGKVSLTSCPTLSPVTLLLSPGTAGISSVDLTTSSFKNTFGSGAAANMGAQLINAETGSVLVPSSISGAISKTTDALGQADFYLGARYFSLGTVGTGGYSANATFSILYQ